MKLGIFGGTFDPVHHGHLLLAECCREQCELDQIWFMPAHVPPHKQGRTLSPAFRRLEMLQLATAGHPSFFVSDIEIERGGVSYTVETLMRVREMHPEAEIFFLMGADSLKDLPTWREAKRICELAVPIVVRRRGSPEPDFDSLTGLVLATRLATIIEHQVQMPLIGFSSTSIRDAVAGGRSIRFLTPHAVEQYIRTHHLYQ